MDILSNVNLVNYVNYVKSLNYEDKLVYLTSNHPEWTINSILMDYYNRNKEVILADKELLAYIENHRNGQDAPYLGNTDLDPDEVGFLMKAWKSQQYHRFMCHIISRYLNKNAVIYPVSEDMRDFQCCVCWRDIYGVDPKKRDQVADMSFKSTAITCKGTQSCICLSCFTQLTMFGQLMTLLEDEDYSNLINYNLDK